MAKVFHGGGLDAAMAEFGGAREEWLDLSTGINPNSYPIPEISAEAWRRLPDKVAEAKLLDSARSYYRVPEDFQIVAAPGTQALIQLLPRLFDTQEVAIVSPTYAEHAHAWKKVGVNVLEVNKLDDIGRFVRNAVVVNPNNPDGRKHPVAELQKKSEQLDCLIVDEAFCDAMPESSLVNEMPSNAIVLKSFGKFFGLAGVRLGFVICKQDWAEQFRLMLGPWAVSGAALEIGTAALSDIGWIEDNREYLHQRSVLQETYLSKIADNDETQFEITGRSQLFTYVRHPNAEQLYRHLAAENILIRPFRERPDYLRFGLCKNDDDLERLSAALKRFVDD